MGRVMTLCAAGVLALAVPAAGLAYGWPVRPFDRAHAIRGAFDDPREGATLDGGFDYSFHFGVDICATQGTAVFAVAPGKVSLSPDEVTVRQRDGHAFAYWHIIPVVEAHRQVAVGTLLGHVAPGWGHVHLAEWNGHTYLNPLRPGALEPFVKHTTPVVSDIDASVIDGRLTATAEAYDLPPIAPPPPWQGARWAPAFVRWRLTRAGESVIPWRIAADFRTNWYRNARFHAVYAPETTENRPSLPGQYVFWLAHRIDLRALPPGTYQLQVLASDTRGNTGSNHATITLDTTRGKPTQPLPPSARRGLRR